MTVKVVAPTREYTFDWCRFELIPNERVVEIIDAKERLKAIFSLDTMVVIKNISYILPLLFGAIYIFIHRKKFTQK